jgi:hypothetical protein
MPYRLPNSGAKTEACVVCGAAANILVRGIHAGSVVDCSRCGDFSISREAADDFLPARDLKQRALLSYLIRKMQGQTRPNLTSQFFDLLPQQALPSPSEVMDNLLLWVADQAHGTPGKLTSVTLADQAIQALIGVVDENDVGWAIDSLRQQGFFVTTMSLTTAQCRLTPEGWLKVEELKRAHVASRYAFFARKFDNSDLDIVFARCLRPAVAQTGYELRTVTQRAGLVDAIIEDEIRRCRFLIADLSDDNPGAYWEAGLAEGLGKPVIYTCRTNVDGEQKRTHFDANHRHTVRWDHSSVESLEQTAKDLKAVIRNTLLGDAKQED